MLKHRQPYNPSRLLVAPATIGSRHLMGCLGGGLLAREPRVPEVQSGRRAELAPQLAPRDVEGVVIAELDLADVLVVDRLDALDERLALLHVALLPQFAEQALLLLVAPPPLERAAERDVQRR